MVHEFPQLYIILYPKMNLRSRNKLLKNIRDNWSKPIDRFRNLDLISLFHENVKNNDENLVDENTWIDLNFDDIFALVDRSNSPIGQQYLYHILHKYESDPDLLNNRLQLAEQLKKDSELREKLQLELIKIDETNTYFIAPIIFGELPKRPKYYPLFWVMSYLAMLSFCLIFVNGNFLFLALAFFLLNLIVNHFNSKKIHEYFAGFSSLNALFICIQKINKSTNSELAELKYLREMTPIIKKINKRIGSLVIDKASMNDMLAGMVDYLNIYFLYDLKKYSRSVGLLKKYQLEIQKIFNTVGKIDCAISIASYLQMVPFYRSPSIMTNNTISFEEVYHPLIPNAISNTLSNLNTSAIITGSNMAGKTTFIKTVGVNIILSQTLNICLARSANVPNLIVKSAIRREENMEDAKSYFFVEIEELQKFIKLSDSNNYLFLIDEIFRGTNTIERLAASTAVLEYLNKNSLVLVTTHDIELQDLLNNKFEMFHFSEQVNGKEFFFDYKLRSGPTTSGNAIKLLEIKNYPKSVIEKATILKEKFITHQSKNILN